MTDKKLTDVTDNNVGKMSDSEIVKALECCSKGVYAEVCEKCTFRNEENKININCFYLEKYALDLINRLQAENERLKNNISAMAITLSNSAKATRHEAYKEFAERLEKRLYNDVTLFTQQRYIVVDHIDNLLKELVGEDK